MAQTPQQKALHAKKDERTPTFSNSEINRRTRKVKEKFSHEPVHGDGRRVKIPGEK
jgi:hypothetical protein